MRRMLAVLALVVLATLGSATVVGAQQYPPTTVDGSVLGEDTSQNFDDGRAGTGSGAGSGAGADGAGAPLARTGSDVLPLVLLGAGLVGAGTFWVVTSRSQRSRT